MIPHEFLAMYLAANVFALGVLAHRRVGAAGAWLFLLAIAPLGVGSGFPFSLTFGAALFVALMPEAASHARQARSSA